MRKRIIWLILSCFMVLSLVLSSCAPKAEPAAPAATPPPTAPTPTTPTPMTPTPASTPTPAAGPEVPKYGGTFVGILTEPNAGFDDNYITGSRCNTLHLTNEQLLMGDWSKGPAGTGEFDFQTRLDSEELNKLWLAESWERPDRETVIFHIRKGIHFAINPKSEASRLVNGRELTAEDVAYSISRGLKNKTSTMYQFRNNFISVKATDKWTVVEKVKESPEYGHGMFVSSTYNSANNIIPREVAEKYGDMRDWRNAVGTGPFMLIDAIPQSSYTLVRNPNYWAKDPLHPQNQLPYIDRITWLEIIDISTQLAAVRTAKVDYCTNIGWEDGEMLVKQVPELRYLRSTRPTVWCLGGRTDKPELPFKDIRIRRALSMAIDYKAIKDDFYGGNAAYPCFPVTPLAGFRKAYTPLEQLPESTKELYSYNPDKAKQLLAEAGYPNGFKTTVIIYDVGDIIDLLSVIAAYWDKIGVNLALDIKPYTVFMSQKNARTYPEMCAYMNSFGNDFKGNFLTRTTTSNMAAIDDPIINKAYGDIWSFENVGKTDRQLEIMKEVNLHVLSQAYYIQPPVPDMFTAWWPWMQNYHGEYSVGTSADYNFPIWIWLDQDMKKAMTGR